MDLTYEPLIQKVTGHIKTGYSGKLNQVETVMVSKLGSDGVHIILRHRKSVCLAMDRQALTNLFDRCNLE